jgi:hypothetical protein
MHAYQVQLRGGGRLAGLLHQVRTKRSDAECFRVAGALFRVCLLRPVAILIAIDLTFLGLVALVITLTERRLIS